jgi:hypothetical protein
MANSLIDWLNERIPCMNEGEKERKKEGRKEGRKEKERKSE